MQSWHRIPTVPSGCLRGLCVVSVFGMQVESILQFLEAESVCSQLVGVREMCLRDLAGRMLLEAF